MEVRAFPGGGGARRSSYPLDRWDELEASGWTEEQLIAEARADGWWVSRKLIRAWVRAGMLPPREGDRTAGDAPERSCPRS